MPSTFVGLHYHLGFSTKHRRPSIHSQWRDRLHQYLAGTIAGLGGFPRQVGGIADHVHLLVDLKPTHCLADVMRELKKASSTWVHDEIGGPSFAWQEGYAAFTISGPSCGPVKEYIADQERHHRRRSFREELIEMLEKAGIHFESKYLD